MYYNCRYVCSVAQSRPTLCNPLDCILPGFSVHGIFQARILEWVAISWYYFLIMLLCLKSVLVTQSCPTLCDPMDCNSPGSTVHEDAPGKNTGVGCHALLQGTFPTQGSNPGLSHFRQILYHLSHWGSQCLVPAGNVEKIRQIIFRVIWMLKFMVLNMHKSHLRSMRSL